MAYSAHENDGHEEDDSYFASMTDIMVGLLFIFIILLMYLVTQIKNENETTPTDAIARPLYENALMQISELEKQIALLKKDQLNIYLKQADFQRTEILRSIKSAIEADNNDVQVELVEEQGILRLKADVLFKSGQSSLDATAEERLLSLDKALKKALPCFTIGPLSDHVRSRRCNPNAAFVDAIFIEGHTDTDEIRKIIEPGIDDNLRLSSRRATNTLKNMVDLDPDLLKFYSVTPSISEAPLGSGNSPIMNASAYGSTRPIAPNSSEAGKSRNRRIDIRLLMYTPRSDTIEAIKKLVEE